MSKSVKHQALCTYRVVGLQQLRERHDLHSRADRGEPGERVRLWRKTRTRGGALQRLSLKLLPWVCVALLFQAAGLSAETVEEAAKREGKVLLYTGMTIPNIHAVKAVFQKKYPYIDLEYYRTDEGKLLERVVMEKRAGKVQADVLHMGSIWINLYKKDGLLVKYQSPEAKFVLPGFKDPEGYWTAYYTAYYNFIYNTKMIAKKDLPRSYEDLLTPKWKGKIGMSIDDVEWFIGMLSFLGDDKGKDFMKRFNDQNLVFRKGRTLILNLMVAGEFPLALGAIHTMMEQQKRGAPIDYIPLPVPTLAAPRMLGIQAGAPHSNAARLLIDFILSKEGQTVLSRISRNPIRTDVPMDKVVKDIMSNPYPIMPKDPEAVAAYKKEFDRIFKNR